MPLANVAPIATKTPITTNVAVSAVPNPIAAVEAINRFDGPKNGIMLNPKAVSRMIMNSIIETISGCTLSLSSKSSA